MCTGERDDDTGGGDGSGGAWKVTVLNACSDVYTSAVSSVARNGCTDVCCVKRGCKAAGVVCLGADIVHWQMRLILRTQR